MENVFVLLDDSRLGGPNRARLFEAPLDIIECTNGDDAGRALADIEKAVRGGLFAAGFFSYELGYLMEPRLAPLLPTRRTLPLIWAGLFHPPRLFTETETGDWLRDCSNGAYTLGEIRLGMDRSGYGASFDQVQDYIARGDIYQLNLTFKGRFDFSGDALALYRDVRRGQRVAHGGLIHTPEFDILSFSPEQFLEVSGDEARTRPMKGTARRGRTGEEDEAQRAWLASDEKSRAENLMIVDLMRNDLGRIAKTGSITVPDLFAVETYRTLHQMTSLVRARLFPKTGLTDLMTALFPPGSVTGAPKIRAMEIIRELEETPRGVYTGALGLLSPDGGCAFNVAIRTLALTRDGKGEIGIGSGLVRDSDADSEYDECLLKMAFLTDPAVEFELIETLKWERGKGFWLLERHMERLSASAAYFDFPFDETAIRERLKAEARRQNGPRARVRLTLAEDGTLSCTSAALGETAGQFRYALSEEPVDSRDVFLFHKTTRRDFLDGTRERLTTRTGCDEVLFVNERFELTEGSFTSLFIERRGVLETPALDCGLLPGTLRAELIALGRAVEAVLGPEDLVCANAVWLGNSVRGLVRATPA